MPKAVEKKLKAEARRKGLSGPHANAYVYGTMRKMEAKSPAHKSPRKGLPLHHE